MFDIVTERCYPIFSKNSHAKRCNELRNTVVDTGVQMIWTAS